MRRAKTLRRLPPQTRKLARYLNDLEKAVKGINSMLERIAEMERENMAWDTRQKHFSGKGEVDPLGDWKQDSILAKVTKKRGGHE